MHRGPVSGIFSGLVEIPPVAVAVWIGRVDGEPPAVRVQAQGVAVSQGVGLKERLFIVRMDEHQFARSRIAAFRRHQEPVLVKSQVRHVDVRCLAQRPL